MLWVYQIRVLKIIIKKFAFKPSGERYQTHKFEYDINNSTNKIIPPLDDIEIAIHPEVTSLSIRVLTSKGTIISFVYCILDDSIYIVNHELKKISPNDNEFDELFEEILNILGYSKERFLQYFQNLCLKSRKY